MISVRRRSSRVFLAGLAASIVMTGAPIFTAADAIAAKCPPASVGGRAIGNITADGVTVPIKPVTYVPGGTLRPPDTAQAVGVSTLNAPLDAQEGTTVLAWHVRYGKGCFGTLNTLLKMPIGSTFTVQAKDSVAREYRITRRIEVPKGRYKQEWFSPVGPHRLALFTCGDLRYEKFHSTIGVFAEPVIASQELIQSQGT
jgi:hypothetical protein